MAKIKKRSRTFTAKNQAHRIAKTRKNLRVKIRDLALEIIYERNLTLDQLSELANDILSGSTAALKNALPASRKSALRQVLDGLGDAWATTAEASVATVKHAQRYGLRFAERDLSGLGKRLLSLENDFIKTVDLYARRLQGDVAKELNGVITQIRKTGTQISPAAEKARTAIIERGREVAAEAASAGVKATQQVLRGVLLSTSGLLEGLGRAVEEGRSKKRRTK